MAVMPDNPRDPFEDEPCVHIYGQWDNHGEAVIRRNNAGLVALRNALDAAITARDSQASVMTNDGEGYGVKVERVNLASSCGTVPYIRHLAWEMAARDKKMENDWKKKRPTNG